MTASSGNPILSPPDVLVVCAANRCRSPIAAFTLGRTLPAVAGVRPVVGSAGIVAEHGTRLCEFVEAAVATTPGGQEFAAAHKPRRLEPGMIGEAALVLTATTRQRAAVIAMEPAARSFAFTLLEAEGLLRADPTEAEIDRLAAAADESATAALASYLNARRGTVLPARRGRLAKRVADPWDIADMHFRGAVRHRRVLQLITDTVASIALRSEQLFSIAVR